VTTELYMHPKVVVKATSNHVRQMQDNIRMHGQKLEDGKRDGEK
jgi:hypothetical protein